jgi:hypothetical protein
MPARKLTLFNYCHSRRWEEVSHYLDQLTNTEAVSELDAADRLGRTPFHSTAYMRAPLSLLRRMFERSGTKRNPAAVSTNTSWLMVHYYARKDAFDDVDEEMTKYIIRQFPAGLLKECAGYDYRCQAVCSWNPLSVATYHDSGVAMLDLLAKSTEAVARKDWEALASIVDGDARSLRRSSMTATKCASEEARFTVLLCLRQIEKAEPTSAPLIDTGFSFFRVAASTIVMDCWTIIVAFL